MIKALWHDDKNTSSLKEVILGKTPSGKLHIQSLYSFVSIGTERTIARGLIPKELGNEMNVPYMEGSLKLPVKYGYSLVGKVMDKQHPLSGRTVHLLHPHQSECLVKATDVFPLPDGIPPPRATLASNMETAVNALWDAELNIGDRILIVGFGLIGALISQLATLFPGVTVHILEKDEKRGNLAQKMGFYQPEEIIPASYDVAFNTSGHESGLQQCIDAVGLEGKIIEMSWYGNKSVNLRLGYDFHWMRKKIISSQVSIIPGSRQHRWDYRRRKELVFELLKNPIFDTFITRIVPFGESPAFFDELRHHQIEDLGVVFSYG